MPLTAKGEKILAAMTRPESEGGYGEEKGKEVFYASANAGTITGVHEDGGKRKRKKKRLAKSGLQRVLYLFFKAEQGNLFTMPTGVKGYVTKRGKVVSAYTAKRKNRGEEQTGELFSQGAKTISVVEKNEQKPEHISEMHQPYQTSEPEKPKKRSKKIIMFHGGEFTDNFAGWSWWSPHYDVATEYGAGDYVYAVLIDPANEVFVDEDSKKVLAALDEGDNEDAWDEQRRQIEEAKKKGATIYCAEDGWAFDHTKRRVRLLNKVEF